VFCRLHEAALQHKQDMSIESSFGSPRARRKEKAQQDLNTTHALWVVRLQEIVAFTGQPPVAAFAALRVEVTRYVVALPPQRKQQAQEAWNAFERAAMRHMNPVS
jgi:hypothetical protein